MAKQYRFLHLGVNFNTRSSTIETIGEIETVLNKAKDWYRYAPNCWLIYTSLDPNAWNDRLKKQITWISQERFLIAVMDLTSRSGWLPKDTWDWIKKDRGEGLGSPAPIR